VANRPCTGWTSDVQGSDGQSPRAKSPTHDERARAPAGERRAGTLDSDGTLNLPLRQRGRRKASSLTIAEPMPRLLTTLETPRWTSRCRKLSPSREPFPRRAQPRTVYRALAFSFFGFVGRGRSESVDRVGWSKCGHVRRIANLRLRSINALEWWRSNSLSGEAGVAAFIMRLVMGRRAIDHHGWTRRGL
jgi:hypothetical protein